MTDSTHRVATDQSQQPQNQENDKNGPQHVQLLSRVINLFLPYDRSISFLEALAKRPNHVTPVKTGTQIFLGAEMIIV